jgi:hypothetical protein
MNLGSRYTGLIDKYRDRLPVSDDTRIISLGEGATPLIRLNNIPRELGRQIDIYVKYEGLHPTGSFKDRGMTMAVTKGGGRGSVRSSALPLEILRPQPRPMPRAPASPASWSSPRGKSLWANWRRR